MCATTFELREVIYLFEFIYYVYSVLPSCMPAHTPQKRAPDLITDGCELPCSCWELTSELLEEQVVSTLNC